MKTPLAQLVDFNDNPNMLKMNIFEFKRYSKLLLKSEKDFLIEIIDICQRKDFYVKYKDVEDFVNTLYSKQHLVSFGELSNDTQVQELLKEYDMLGDKIRMIDKRLLLDYYLDKINND